MCLHLTIDLLGVIVALVRGQHHHGVDVGRDVCPDAVPLPFWRKSFLPLPATSARVFVDALPWRLFAWCAITT